jgi:NADH-quinone oxidoreductase subunit F
MIFSMVGKVKMNGLVEVPMGMTLRELVFDVGGGVPDKRAFKAVQTGGPSGGCIPEHLMDLPVDYDKLAEVGSIMGSGGMVVMDETSCMVNVAKYFLAFTKDESCGKCTPCREGTRRMLQILTEITEGRGRQGDIELLEDMGRTIVDSALCALGGTAPNPVLTTIRYFRDEYEEHIRNKRCPAGACKGLFQLRIDPDRCIGCGQCLGECPSSAISGEKKKTHVLDTAKCIQCGICREICPTNAVRVK